MSQFPNFKSFYPYYLSEHADVTCRRLHFMGSSLVLVLIISSIILRKPGLLVLLPVAGYGFAWAGHFFFEKNRPATFKNPLYSLMGDWVMYFDTLRGKIKF